jgi:hypothetical protein
MREALFIDGLPARLTPTEFRRFHLQSFPKIGGEEYDELLEDAIDAVYAVFTGVDTIWARQPAQIYYDKTLLCYRLLTAWYITDLYPTLSAGVASRGGIPLKFKKIGGVNIGFRDVEKIGNGNYQDLLDSLQSNVFGVKARFMIRASAARVRLRNRRFV